jgi:hypothetical protein
MSLHDAYARTTPFEIAFPDRERFDALVSSVAAEAAERGMDPTVPDAFVAFASVGAFLAELHGDEAPRVALLELGALTFHAVQFVRAGCPLFLLEAAASRQLVDMPPSGRPAPPAPSGYVQLPQHLFWTRGVEGGAPESVDGMFWTVTSEGRLHVLPIVGLRPDRPGFGALSLPDAPLAHAEGWVSADIRERGGDYTSTLPGAELDGLYAIESAGEVLKLLARFFVRAGATNYALEAPGAAEVRTNGPKPSALPYTRVRSGA